MLIINYDFTTKEVGNLLLQSFEELHHQLHHLRQVEELQPDNPSAVRVSSVRALLPGNIYGRVQCGACGAVAKQIRHQPLLPGIPGSGYHTGKE